MLALEVAPTIKIGPYVHLGIAGPGTAASGTVAAPDALIAGAVTAAKQSKVAVVFVGESNGEGVDRSTLALPGAQDALVEAVAHANPNTIVVLNTSGPVLMPWLRDVRAVVEMWYPGDQFGRAAADLLFGDASPNGRLPMTFPASEAQGPGQTPATYLGVSALPLRGRRTGVESQGVRQGLPAAGSAGDRVLRTHAEAAADVQRRHPSWGVTPGHYTVAVGSSSAELRAAVSFVVDRRWR